MIASDTSRWFKWVFSHYNERYLLQRQFHAIDMLGDIDPAPQGRPVLYMMNHSSWWDGLIVYHAIVRDSSREHFMMMDERQMSRYRFFRKIGAFSIDKTSNRGLIESLHYSEQLLKQGHGVWLFPQGDIQHLEHRPLQFQNGIGYLLERCPEAIVQPVTAYYSLGLHHKADVSLLFGSHIQQDWLIENRKHRTARLRSRLEQQLNDHRDLVIDANGEAIVGARSLLQTTRSTNEKYDAWKNGVAKWTSFFGR
ncbi:lysophospholipid acyltransferase family protein [Paenibacillus alginolyticus]|uniref:Lysophospholipid acyltransferase family protein n=1 Tax=Paenibacillus alginolyticus TaxID=59839 RepID=A0ABT4GLK0_9BACL|nr:lysophospholipid acyltransferase family protein [Paenibacillus alginolyticus]MCY9697078.1 lysophospholipid acyltransferase family protein [Paenibacillus alginolyticus]MEC0146431.1 lysophospholipid acyltransferase family protein [Paenibacillus alginolyticus]